MRKTNPIPLVAKRGMISRYCLDPSARYAIASKPFVGLLNINKIVKKVIAFALLVLTCQFLFGPTAALADEIKILFAYTTRAAVEAGGAAELKSSTEDGLRRLNEALRNSRIGYQATAIPKFVEVTSNVHPKNRNEVEQLLGELGKPAGKYCELHRYRKQVQGDIVCLIFSGYTMGLANLGQAKPGEFMVCHIDSFGGNWVFPHEFGHNMGAKHSPNNAPSGKYRWKFGLNHYRTVSNNGGVSIPYFSEDRTVQHEVEGKMRTIKLGDANHDNARVMRRLAPMAAKIGENLADVAPCKSALKVRIVDPAKEPMPKGAKPQFQLTDFTATRSGKNVNVSFSYEASRKFAEKAQDDNMAFQITPFTKDGKQDPFNGYYRNGFNPGKNTAKKVFDGNPKFPGREMKPGSYFELQWVTWNKDGTATVRDVVKRVYITDSGVRIEDVAGKDMKPKFVKNGKTSPPPKRQPATSQPATNKLATNQSKTNQPPKKQPATKDKPNPSKTAGSSNTVGDEEFEVIVLAGNSDNESFRVTQERNGTKIGEYHLAGQDELWRGGKTTAISNPAYYEKVNAYRSVTNPMTLRKNGKSKKFEFTRLYVGARFGDSFRVKNVGSGAVKTWEVRAVNAKGTKAFKLHAGGTISLQEMTFNPKTDVP